MSNNNYKIIKQIGKGSFSDVYLCEKQTCDSPITLSNLESSLFRDFFIIKKIDINSLVEQYLRKERFEMRIKSNSPTAVTASTTALNKSTFAFTPPNKNYMTTNPNKNLTINNTVDELQKGENYYRKKLIDIICSEIRILKLLDGGSENIVQYYDHEINKKNGLDCIYNIHLEYCAGGDLYSYLKDGDTTLEKRNMWGGFSNRFLYQFINQISNGLQYIHDSNLIHRDIKLQNILMKIDLERCNVIFKISDLGFACYDVSKLKSKLDEDTGSDYLISKYYKICGTPYYMAPEILLAKSEIDYDWRIDIWSFGVSIYQLTWNKLPFKATSVTQLKKMYSTIGLKLSMENETSEILRKIINSTICMNKIQRLSCNQLIDICKMVRGCDHWDGDTSNKKIDEILNETKIGEDWEKVSQSSGKSVNSEDSDIENFKNLNIDKTFLDWMKKTN